MAFFCMSHSNHGIRLSRSLRGSNNQAQVCIHASQPSTPEENRPLHNSCSWSEACMIFLLNLALPYESSGMLFITCSSVLVNFFYLSSMIEPNLSNKSLSTFAAALFSISILLRVLGAKSLSINSIANLRS